MAIRTLTPAPSPSPAQLLHHHHHHHHHLHWTPSPSPIAVSTTQTATNLSQSQPPPESSSKLPVDFSPTLIAMVVVIAAAFLVISYSRLISRYLIRLLHRWRRWRRRHRRRYLPSSNGDLDSPPQLFDSPDGFHLYSPYGLDESVIKTLPLYIYTAKNCSNKQINNNNNNGKECAVCLLEFEDDDYVRTLPVCSHAFHVDCIDIWLRSHANCPLCRTRIFRSESPFIPLMAARIRPSLDESILRRITLEPVIQTPPPSTAATNSVTEIIEEASPRRNYSINFNNYSQSEDRFILKRSYSFSFERSCNSERMLVMEPATGSPWRQNRRGSFWNKRSSPFGSLSKARVFSFRYYRGMKSPFTRRKGGFFPLSERYLATGGGSSRRSKSTASTPMYNHRRSWAAGGGGGGFSSSRLRCGDPEALLSPERYSRR